MTRDKIDSKLSATNTAAKIESLVAELTKCMTQETLAIQSSNQEIASKMSQEKSRLLTTYQMIEKELQQKPEMFNSLDDDYRQYLKGLLSDFDTVMKDNLATIHAGKKAISRVIHRLLKKARETASVQAKSYNAKGEIVEKSYGTAPVSKKIKGQLNEQY